MIIADAECEKLPLVPRTVNVVVRPLVALEPTVIVSVELTPDKLLVTDDGLNLPDVLRGSDARRMLTCLYRVPDTKKRQFLEIVAASGTDNIEAVVQKHLRLWRGNEADLRYEAVLNSHPAFAEALTRARSRNL